MAFTWKPTYLELAQRLVGWEARQGELLAFLRSLDADGLTVLPLDDRGADGASFPLTEIDPFTFFAAFNRNTVESNRLEIIRRCNAFFGLTSPAPTDLRGIPTANNQNSWFFAYANARKADDVKALWALARAAVTGGLAGVPASAFDRCLQIRQVKLSKLTQGLFWLRHDEFLAMDGSTRTALEKKGIAADVSDFVTYRQVVEAVRSQVGSDFVSLSADSYHEPEPAAAGTASSPKRERANAAAVLTAGLAKAEGDRAIRAEAQLLARQILAERVGRLTERDLRDVMRHLNTCRGKNGKVYSRFSPQFTGHNANGVVAAIDRLNPLVKALWDAEEDESVAEALNAFFAADIPKAGRSLPTAILFLKSPERFAVWLRSMDQAARRFFNSPEDTGAKDAAAYFEYCELVRRVRAQFSVPAELHDWALWVLSSSENKSPEPEAPAPVVVDESENSVESVADYLGMAPELVKRIANRAQRSGQVVLSGPPGTGKTELALRLAYALAGNKTRVEKIQFHPSYGYEEFIEGLRPNVTNGQLHYEIVPGIFRALCDRARQSPKQMHVLVIDEINRGNLPRIFGELLMLLERRDETATLPHSKDAFSIPPNVVLIGTMNNADRSIALMDLALRRRFDFFDLAPDEGALRTWLERKGLPVGIAKLFETLNRDLEKAGIEPERLVGHSYFMRDTLDGDGLEELWDSRIIPLVRELFFADDSKLSHFTLERVQERSDARPTA